MEGGLSCWESSGEITPPSSLTLGSRPGGRVPKAGRELEWDVSRLALRARGSWAGICWDLCRGDGAGVTQGVHGGVGTLPALGAAGLEVLVALDALGKGAGSGTPKSEPHLGKAAGALGMLTALPAGDVGTSPRSCCEGNGLFLSYF